MQRVEKITGRQIPFYETDIRDREACGKFLLSTALTAAFISPA